MKGVIQQFSDSSGSPAPEVAEGRGLHLVFSPIMHFAFRYRFPYAGVQSKIGCAKFIPQD
jgi:hypothetical protein